jgi:ABC-type glycerol-3-phosphate transport system permease component
MKKAMRTKEYITYILAYIIMIGLILLAIFPIYWIINNSFKTSGEFFMDDLSLPKNPTLEWYIKIFDPRMVGPQLPLAYATTIFYFGITSPIVAILAALNGFVCAHYPLKGKSALLSYFLIGMAIPPQVPTLTLFVFYSIVGLRNTFQGVILLYVASGVAFNTFLMYSYFKQVPKELFESAYVDGAGDLTTFFYIGLPISKPMLFVVLVLHGIWVWNEYVLSYTFSPVRTVTPLAATVTTAGVFGSWMIPLALAGLTLVLLPIIIFYIFTNRKIVEGMIQGALGKF